MGRPMRCAKTVELIVSWFERQSEALCSIREPQPPLKGHFKVEQLDFER